MQFVVEGENTQIGQFTLNFESNVDQSLHTRCLKNMQWIMQLLKMMLMKFLGTHFVLYVEHNRGINIIKLEMD